MVFRRFLDADGSEYAETVLLGTILLDLQEKILQLFGEAAFLQHTSGRRGEAAGLDNGFLSCEKPERLAEICQSFAPTQLKNLFERWVQTLP